MESTQVKPWLNMIFNFEELILGIGQWELFYKNYVDKVYSVLALKYTKRKYFD